MGEGPTLVWGPIAHPYLYRTVKALAERLEIPLSAEPAPRYSATDSDAMQVVAEGIPNIILGIPLRYMHTPVEMVMLKDLTRAAGPIVWGNSGGVSDCTINGSKPARRIRSRSHRGERKIF